jgi:gliding motility-associated-like protein
VNECQRVYPNIVTPNGDGVNDVLFIRNLPEGCEVNIFDRWGHRVYHSADYRQDWNGTGLSDGVFYYSVVLPDKENEAPHVGYVTLLR